MAMTMRMKMAMGSLVVGAAVLVFACGEQRESAFRDDILVNDPSADRGNNTTQSETAVARHNDVVVVGYNDSGEFTSRNSMTGYAYSVDGGRTFTDAGVLEPAKGGRNLGDAALAVDRDGNFYFATLAVDANARSFIGVARSKKTKDEVTFEAPVLVPGLDRVGFQDKELIAVDVSGGRFDGNVYLVWTEFPPRAPSRILFSRSTDGGRTFSSAVRLSTSGSGVQGAMPVVGKRGELYVAWEDRSGRITGLIKFRRSDDGGASWGPEITAATFTRMTERNATAACGRPALNGHIRVSEFPSIDVDRSDGPGSGNLYAAFSADPGRQARGDNADVFVVRSTDGGRNWSDPLNVVKGKAVSANPDGSTNDNFMPVLTVSPEGQINVFFYDRRNDRSNRKIDVYRAVSTDGGASWVNERVTAESFDIPRLRPNFDPLVKDCYMGDYNDATVDGSGFYLTWGDNRRTLKNTRFPRGRPDPDVRFRTVSLRP
jgi:hypothetical protein